MALILSDEQFLSLKVLRVDIRQCIRAHLFFASSNTEKFEICSIFHQNAVHLGLRDYSYVSQLLNSSIL